MAAPGITLIVGPMFSEKSAHLITYLRRHEVAGQKVMAFRGRADTRTPPRSVRSRNGLSTEASEVDSGEEMLRVLGDRTDARAVGIDEAQFVRDVAPACDALVARGLHVYVAMLSGTYARKPWPGAAELVALGARVVSLQAVCSTCKRFEASLTRLKRRQLDDPDAAEGARPLVGDGDEYEPQCPACWHASASPSSTRR